VKPHVTVVTAYSLVFPANSAFTVSTRENTVGSRARVSLDVSTTEQEEYCD